MNREEAKFILQSCRPGGQDRADPRFAEALALAESDAELKQWFAEQRAFDSQLGTQVQAIPAPAGLKQQILDSAPRPIRFWPVWTWRPAYALAAGLVLLAVAIGVWWKSRPTPFTDFCKDVSDRSWALSQHVQYESTDLSHVRLWLASQQAQSDFPIPSALQNAQVQGASVVQWHGQKISVLCLLEGSRHMHLLVAGRIVVAGGPGENEPELEEYGRIRTASWKNKEKTYVLTGLNVRTFIKKFRQGGHWNLTS